MHRVVSLLACLAILIPHSRAGAVTLRVPSEYPTIQAAIDACGFGDTVLVAPGDYTEYVTRSVPGYGGATAMAFLKDGVVLKSEVGAAQTALRHGTTSASGAAGIVTFGLVSESTVVDGFSIVADLPSRAGIAQLDGAKLTVRNCVFRGLDIWAINANFSDLEVADSRFEDCIGFGGISQEEGLSLLTRCTFIRCQGSAVLLSGFSGGRVDRAEIRDCMFQECSETEGGGGAINVANYSAGGVIDQCVFINNNSTRFGGAVVLGAANPTVTDCLFIGNHAASGGGSLVIGTTGLATVTGNTFFDSSLSSPSSGGAAIYFTAGGPAILNNNIIASTFGSPAVVRSFVNTTTGCNIFWDNPDGIGANYTPGPTDGIADPLFCDPLVGDLELDADSPCLPEHSLGCGLIGAFGQGCGTVSLNPTSWGRLKAAYR